MIDKKTIQKEVERALNNLQHINVSNKLKAESITNAILPLIEEQTQTTNLKPFIHLDEGKA